MPWLLLGLKFDSSEAIEEVDGIMRSKLTAEFDSSVDMAIERGQFEVFNRNIEDTSEFVQMMQDEFPELYDTNDELWKKKHIDQYGGTNRFIKYVGSGLIRH